jgi:hypothetical protein
MKSDLGVSMVKTTDASMMRDGSVNQSLIFQKKSTAMGALVDQARGPQARMRISEFDNVFGGWNPGDDMGPGRYDVSREIMSQP